VEAGSVCPIPELPSLVGDSSCLPDQNQRFRGFIVPADPECLALHGSCQLASQEDQAERRWESCPTSWWLLKEGSGWSSRGRSFC